MNFFKLLKFRFSKLYIFLIIIFSILSAGLSITYPVIIGNIIDKIGITINLTKDFIILLLVFILLFVSNLLLNYFLSSYTSKLSKNLRNILFNKINSLPIPILEKFENGNIINLFSADIENIANGTIQSLSKIISGIFTIILATYIMLNLNVSLTIVLILLSILMFGISKFIVSHTNNMFSKRANLLANLNSYTEEIISGKKTFDNFNYQNIANKNFNKRNNELYKYGYKMQFYSSLTNPSTRFISNLSYIIIAMLGIIFCKNGTLTIGNVSTFLIYTNLFTRPFNEITSVFSEIQTAIASGKRIINFISTTSPIALPIENSKLLPNEQNYSIEFKNVYFSYTDKPFIQNFNLYIPNGKSIAIVGKTGSGKTTIINLLNRFYEINSGEILLNNINIQDININNLRQKIDMVLQDTQIFQGTIKENIAYGKPDATIEEIKNAAKLSFANSFIEKLPSGYDTYISSSDMLSEGQVQLLNIARIMLIKPPILILDEATSNIDLLTENLIKKAIFKLTENSTSIIIAHRLSTIKNCDLIVFIENGNIVEIGNHEELINKKGAYYNMYKSQFNIK